MELTTVTHYCHRVHCELQWFESECFPHNMCWTTLTTKNDNNSIKVDHGQCFAALLAVPFAFWFCDVVQNMAPFSNVPANCQSISKYLKINPGQSLCGCLEISEWSPLSTQNQSTHTKQQHNGDALSKSCCLIHFCQVWMCFCLRRSTTWPTTNPLDRLWRPNSTIV